MSLANFQYGIGAVVFPADRETFTVMRDELIASTRPANTIEQLVVEQLLHAKWELHRVRTHSNCVEAEESLLAAFNRASRNLQRATRQLSALQSARASAELCAGDSPDFIPPCANMAKVPRASNRTARFKNWKSQALDGGYFGPEWFDPCYQSETPEAA